ncbi:MAG: LysR family transcriptional regulator [Neisseriaceae bacterium]|nr:LysR family transcriptional regulator [Neisseriaceae bacterium]
MVKRNSISTVAQLKRLEFVTLSSYLSVCRTHSPSASAQLLGASRSGVSERLSKLEQGLNIPLFERAHKKLYVNEQGLKLGKYILPMLLLEQFAHQCAQDQPPSVQWLSVRLPLRFYGGPLTHALEVALRHCQRHYPYILVWPQPLDSYDVRQTNDTQWQPPWSLLGEISIDWTTQDDEAQPAMPQGHWCVLSHVDSGLSHHLHPGDLQALKLDLPRMPWLLLQQIAAVTAAATWSFEHISQDYRQLMSQPNPEQRMILVNSLLLDPEIMAPDWQVSRIDHLPVATLHTQTNGHHPIVAEFEQAFRQALASSSPNDSLVWPTQTQLKHWHYLYQTIHSGSISAGAQALFMSQPALSVQLKQLEQALGSQLLERGMGVRQLVVTPFGQLFYELCQGMNDAHLRLLDYSEGQRLNQQKHLSLGVLPSVDNKSTLLQLIANQVTAWQQKNPQVFLEIVEERHRYLVDALRSQALHLAIIEADSPWVTHLPLLAPEAMGLVLSTEHPNAGVTQLDWSQLGDYPLVLPRKGNGMRLIIDQHCLSLGLTLRPALESDSLNINQFWLREGRYASILPKSAVSQLIEQGKVVFIALAPTLNRVLRVAHLSHRVLSPTEQSLIQCLLEAAGPQQPNSHN